MVLVSILGVSEMRWNSCGRLRVATGETVLYSGMDEGENHVEPTGEAKERRLTRMAELESKHLTRNETKGTAQNRVRWHALVENLCSTRNEEE